MSFRKLNHADACRGQKETLLNPIPASGPGERS